MTAAPTADAAPARWDFTRSGTWRRADLATCAALAVYAMVWFAPGVLSGEVFCTADTLSFFFISRGRMYEALHGGGFHLWDPLVGLGVPRLGNPQNSLLSPASALFYLLPPTSAFRFYPAFALGFIALGAYALFRVRGGSPLAAAFGSLSWTTLGTVFDHVQHPPAIETLMWLPPTLLSWEMWRRWHRALWAVSLCLCVSFQIFGGSPQYVSYNALLASGWMAIDTWRAPDRGAALRDLMEAAAFGVAGVLIGCWQLLPTAELYHVGHRALLAGTDFTDSFRATPCEILLMYAQEVFWFITPPLLTYGAPYCLGPTQSVLPLLLALSTLRRGRWAEWGLIAFFVLGMLGSAGPITPLLQTLIPPLGQLRAPLRMIVPAAFLVAWLSTLGMQAALDARPARRIAASLCMVWLAATTLYFKPTESLFTEPDVFRVPEVVTTATPRVAMLTPRKGADFAFIQNVGPLVGKSTLFMREAAWPRNYFEATFASQFGSLDQTGKLGVMISNNGAILIHPDRPLLKSFGLRTVFDVTGDTCVARPVTGAVNRFYAVTDVRVADTPARRWQVAQATDWDARRTAWVDSEEVARRVATVNGGGVSRATSIHVERDEPSTQILSVEGGGGLLVTSELYYPGWKVKVDDVPQEAVEVNLALRGVVVPAGHHRVVWTYAPNWVGWAILASVVAAPLVFLVILLRRRYAATMG